MRPARGLEREPRQGRRSGNPTVSAINTIAPVKGAIVFIVESVGGMRTREGATVVSFQPLIPIIANCS